MTLLLSELARDGLQIVERCQLPATIRKLPCYGLCPLKPSPDDAALMIVSAVASQPPYQLGALSRIAYAPLLGLTVAFCCGDKLQLFNNPSLNRPAINIDRGKNVDLQIVVAAARIYFFFLQLHPKQSRESEFKKICRINVGLELPIVSEAASVHFVGIRRPAAWRDLVFAVRQPLAHFENEARHADPTLTISTDISRSRCSVSCLMSFSMS